ncbi:MAG: DUF3303 family protein [Anaerolineales bacterium]|nr:hypothetical protein [Anaerolineales bacterium]MCS7247573.1 hypothetical protein [Anaerolineales bacterium]MDW8161384.1 DUF3303 family protein [Anaerolineales bacterium]MDW8447993.1 DUF3303 family protein [Anaerolineales bacterium]
MTLYFVRHQHAPDQCPAKDPQMGSMLLQHLSSEQANRFGIHVHGDAVLDGAHTLVLILEADSQAKVEEYLQPFKQVGLVEVFPASPCERVIERRGC